VDRYSSLNVIQVIKGIIKWSGGGGHIARMGQRESAYRTLVGKPVGKRPLGRFRHRRDDDIKVNLQDVGWRHGMDLSSSV
jgi:hypothetical protein